jgi:hypothetical protein
MKHHIALTIVVAVLLLLGSASLGAYYLRGDAGRVHTYERGLPTLPQHVLIATQGSTFKDRLVTALAARLELRPAYVKVIDVEGLRGVNAADWQAIVIVHNWAFGSAPRAVSAFVARLPDTGKVIDVTTSSSGHEKLPGVDVISSASVLDDVPELVTQISSKIDARLAGP